MENEDNEIVEYQVWYANTGLFLDTPCLALRRSARPCFPAKIVYGRIMR